MGLKIDFFKLNKTAREVSLKLYDIYINYLNNEIEFPYDDVDKLINRYESFYLKVYKKKNSNITKLLCKINIYDEMLDVKFNVPSKEMILSQVSEKAFFQILFNAEKYIPFDVKSKEVIFNKLYPIAINLSVVEITDIYSKMKKSAIIRGVVFNDDAYALLQEMFVSYIISILSHNSYNKYSFIRSQWISESEWTPEDVCRNILNEPILYINSSMKKIK